MSKPQRILMLAFPDCQMLDVTGPLQMFAGVSDELALQLPFFEVGTLCGSLVSSTPE